MISRSECDYMVLLRQRVWTLASQLTQLQQLRTQVLKAQERTVGRRSRVRAIGVARRRERR